MKANEAMIVWAKRKLDEYDIEYNDTDYIEVRDEVVYSGYCDTCWSEDNYVKIYVNGVEKHMHYGYTADLLDELIEIASGEK